MNRNSLANQGKKLKQWNALQRITAVFQGEIPDRVPSYELTINPGVIDRLNPGMSYYDFIEYHDYDAVGPNVTWDGLGLVKWLDEAKKVFIDRWGVVRRFTTDVIPVPLEGPIKSAKDLAGYVPPNPLEDPILVKVEELVGRFKNRRATFILGRDVWTGSYMIRGMENLLIDFLTDPAMVRDIVGMQVEYYKVLHRKVLAMGVDIIHLVDDYAYGSGPLMSPELFAEFLLPGLKTIVKDIKEHGGLCMKHTDGAIWKILDDIVSSGVDGVGPLEPEAGMDLREVKEKYPGLVVMGNVGCDNLGRASTAEIEEEVKQLIQKCAPGGRYILSSGNSIASSALPENFATMMRTLKLYGGYGEKGIT
ncbi:MAG: hypothetical protein E4G96_09785 [Chrysiogenales bacterium]|nr:MAG: hypothetical protein E4G96_09785 [Chrysiogenales bacterium]